MVDPVTAIGLGIAANALYDVGTATLSKTRAILDRDDHADDLDELAATFEQSLRGEVTRRLTTVEGIDAAAVDDEWDAVTAELASLDAVFESEAAAIDRITAAIGDGLGYDLDDDADLRGQIAIAVASAYRGTMDTFLTDIEGTELEGALEREAGIRRSEALDRIDDRLGTIERRLRRREEAALGDAGFEWVGPLYFQGRDPGDPFQAWRIGFSLAEAAEGYALERQRPLGEDERRSVTLERRSRCQSPPRTAISTGTR